MKKLFFAFAALVSMASPALAQRTYPTAPDNLSPAPGVVPLQCDVNNVNCAPVNAANPQMVDIAAYAYGNSPVDTTTSAGQVSNPGNKGVGMPLLVAPSWWNGTANIQARGDSRGLYVVPTVSSASTNGVVPTANTAVGSNVVLKAATGNLYSFNAVAGASAGFVLLFDATAAPADGAVTPIKCYPLAANGSITFAFPMPLNFANGMVMVFSTTGCFTKTASATAFLSGDVK